MINKLLREDLTAHYRLPRYTESNLSFSTQANYFELEDSDTREMILSLIKAGGTARFNNPALHNITFVNYDKFISELHHTFQYGTKRCDALLSDDIHFILAELKDRKNTDKAITKVRSKAKKQLLESLQTLNSVPSISTFIGTKTIKKCCYFNKQAKEVRTLTAVQAFNRLPEKFPKGVQCHNSYIEALGFEFWEFTGNQTFEFN